MARRVTLTMSMRSMWSSSRSPRQGRRLWPQSHPPSHDPPLPRRTIPGIIKPLGGTPSRPGSARPQSAKTGSGRGSPVLTAHLPAESIARRLEYRVRQLETTEFASLAATAASATSPRPAMDASMNSFSTVQQQQQSLQRPTTASSLGGGGTAFYQQQQQLLLATDNIPYSVQQAMNYATNIIAGGTSPVWSPQPSARTNMTQSRPTTANAAQRRSTIGGAPAAAGAPADEFSRLSLAAACNGRSAWCCSTGAAQLDWRRVLCRLLTW